MNVLPYSSALLSEDNIALNSLAELTDTQLVALVINQSIHERYPAEQLLAHFGSIRELLNTDCKGLLFDSKYLVPLQAAKEICRRSDASSLKRLSINTPSEIRQLIKKQLRDYHHEVFAALFFDSQHRAITFEPLFNGTINCTTIYIRYIIERIIHLNASAIILAHNHPSGDYEQSKQDVTVTKQLKNACALIDVQMLDHWIVADNTIFSIEEQRYWLC